MNLIYSTIKLEKSSATKSSDSRSGFPFLKNVNQERFRGKNNIVSTRNRISES